MGSSHYPPDPAEGVGPCLRRRCPALGSHLAMEGFNLWTIQQILGHKDLRTMRYSHLAAEHLQQAVNHVDTVRGEWLEAIERREQSS
jgi:integrase